MKTMKMMFVLLVALAAGTGRGADFELVARDGVLALKVSTLEK